ncbi:ATP-dependent DNA helicase Q5 [Echinococcus granulosus]|uniref:DNA 3'-5' helicase n=1 Tax=Echinococcus granulosus TaxID=6210 RepID=W6UPR1_ECHGR|nr:ATP-dependent DNA helicase Q5 [Echinococcus granulosus]EUB55389.1 ATP-dependent DNA helicase Q5 [Echinococcus granulosus]
MSNQAHAFTLPAEKSQKLRWWRQEFVTGVFRSNLYYDVMFSDLIKTPYDDLSLFIRQCLFGEDPVKSPVKNSSGIVYCRTREDCETVAYQLSLRGIPSRAYHAGLGSKDRTRVQEEWFKGDFLVVVATISFGMGVDNAHVRCVVHWTVPKSLAAYYQESGRAGRDGLPSHCRIYYAKQERDTVAFLVGQMSERALTQKKKEHREKGVQDLALMINYVESVNFLLSPQVPWISAAEDSLLIDPESKLINGLTGKTRDQTLQLLITAVCGHLTSTSDTGSDVDPEKSHLSKLAAQLEHQIFKTSKDPAPLPSQSSQPPPLSASSQNVPPPLGLMTKTGTPVVEPVPPAFTDFSPYDYRLTTLFPPFYIPPTPIPRFYKSEETRMKTSFIANVVVRSLSRYYSLGAFKDKSFRKAALWCWFGYTNCEIHRLLRFLQATFKDVARELTRRLVKSGISDDEVHLTSYAASGGDRSVLLYRYWRRGYFSIDHLVDSLIDFCGPH